jgi:hypothetical protein
MHKLLVLIFSLYFLNANNLFSQDGNWKLIKNDEGIKIYSRPASEESALKELKVTTELNASLSAVVSVLAAKELFPKWVYGCSVSEILKKTSDLEIYHYQVTDMPWPIEKRDVIIHTLISQDTVTRVVKIACKGIPDYISQNKDCIRIISFKAHWTLTPNANGKVDLVYIMMVDPAGSLPTWIINMVAAEGPMKTIKNLRDFLPPYKEVSLDYIKN